MVDENIDLLLLYHTTSINSTIKRMIISFQFKMQFITFSLYHFFSSKLRLICFLQFLFIKYANNLSTIMVFITCVHGLLSLKFLIANTSSVQFGL